MTWNIQRFSLAALLAIAVVLVACGGDDKKQDEGQTGSVSGLPGATASGSGATAPSSAPDATTAAGMGQPKDGAVLERVVAGKIGMDAPVEVKGINGRGEMEDPSGKDAVAWYDFSEFPGFGGNAVFSGHVDWYTGELGVFGKMKDLKEGDELTLKLSDGMELKYKVTSSKLYESDKAPVEEIVGRTDKDSLTFITCEGAFSRGDYSHRRVVRAERVA